MRCETIRFLRDGELPGLEIGKVTRSSHCFPNHTHDHFAIGLMEEGASYCQGFAKSGALLRQGQVAVINPGQVHSGMPPAGTLSTYSMFYVSNQWMSKVASELSDKDVPYPEVTRMIVDTPQVVRAFTELNRQAEGKSSALEKQCAVISAFSRLMALHGNKSVPRRQTGGESKAVRLVKEFLRDNLDQNVSLEELAGHAGFSRYHLVRVFKKATGISPHAFHTNIRLERACKLLLEGYSILEAGLMTGFTDQSHFTKKFKQFFGATPGQYIAGL